MFAPPVDMKRMKIAGGRPAIAKRVTADLDSDDEVIVNMKEARFLEKDIAKALVDQGRTAYNPKTIGTRWRRIKTALQKRQDDLLDADLTDWHEGDVSTAPWNKVGLGLTDSRMMFFFRRSSRPTRRSRDVLRRLNHEDGASWPTK